MNDARSELIVAEASGDVTTVYQHRQDDDPTIRAAALGAQQRLTGLTPDDLRRALSDPHASVRCRALELAIADHAVDIAPYLDDDDDVVVETAAWALGERGTTAPETIAHLRAVATDHDVSICREAAVAALGAIGAPEGLPTILQAMHDRAPVRRRAVLALAPFAGDDVTAALRAALGDRDRQVRQAAEDLLGSDVSGERP